MAREILKKARKEAGMTQQQMADKLEIGLRYYQNIEAGDRTGDFAIWDTLLKTLQVFIKETPEIS